MTKKDTSPTSLVTRLIIAVLIALGFFLLYISHYIENGAQRLLLEHAATILIVVMTLHIVFDWRMIRHVEKVIKAGNQDNVPIVERATRTTLANFVSQYELSKSVRDSGLVQINENLDYDELANTISHIWGGEIRFLVISLPNLDRLRDAIKTAINVHNCTVQVLILDESAEETIAHRELSLGHERGKGRIAIDIGENKDSLKKIRAELHPDKAQKLQCYFYKEWVSVSMYVCNDELLFGHYFLMKKGTESQYFRVKGRESRLFVEFGAHFDEIWRRSAKEENDVFKR